MKKLIFDRFLEFCKWRREKLFLPELTEIEIEKTYKKFENL